MRYKANYRNKNHEEYWRTFIAIDLGEAIRTSKKLARKGFRCVRVQSDE